MIAIDYIFVRIPWLNEVVKSPAKEVVNYGVLACVNFGNEHKFLHLDWVLENSPASHHAYTNHQSLHNLLSV